MKAPPKMAPPSANADAKGGPSADPNKKKKALPPPSNPPPKAGGSAAAAFRSKSSLPPPNAPPPGAGAPSASVAKIRGAARPPSGAPPGVAQAKAGPPPNGQAKAMGPPSTAPPTGAAPSMGPPSSAPPAKTHPTGTPPSTAPPKAAVKPPITPRNAEGDSKGDAKSATSGPPKPKPDAKRTPPTSARGPPGNAKPSPRSAPVDILGDDSSATANHSAAPIKSNPVPVGKPPKPVAQTQRPPATAPGKAPPADKPPAMKPPLVMKSTMEVLNDANAALSARSRNAEEGNDSSRRSSTSSTKEKENPGVFTTKMGMAAQFSTQSRLNVPEEEVIIVKKRESKSTEAETKSDGTGNASSSRPIANMNDSFEDVEEIPFLEDGKPDAKSKDDQEEKSADHKDDPEIVIESKHGPPKPSSGHSSSTSQSDSRSEHKDNNFDEEKDDGESILRRNATHEDIYDELRKMKRESHSPREDEQTGSGHDREHDHDRDYERDHERERDNSRSSSSSEKDKGSTNSDETTNDQSGRENRENRDRERERDREKSREKRKDRRRSKQDEPKKIQAQFFNPKSVPYIPDHLLEFVKRPLECGRGQIVKCFIERNDSGPNKLAPIYTLLLEVNSSSGRPIMYARKKATSRITSHYVISMNRWVESCARVYKLKLALTCCLNSFRDDLFLSRMMRSHQYIGKLRSSTSLMEYCLYDQGDNPEDLDSDCEVDDELRQSIRAELAVIRYHNTKKGAQNVLDSSNFVFMHKRETKYDPLSSCIVDFRSRATCVSVKNFQLVHSEPTNEEMRDQYRKAYPDFVYEDQGTVSLPQEYVLLQLGKVGKDCFNMDFHDKVPERNGEKFVVQDLAFRPDGSQVVAAVGTRVLVYDAVDGTLLHSLKGHKGTVYAVDYSHDGKRFASGGADNIVIIWTDKAEGILKYTHNDSIQKLAYNPQSQCLASCTASDFGLWAPEQKSVAKHKVVAKILSACWSKDGQLLALGLLNGNVTLRDKLGAEKRLIERSSAPVWALAWSPAHEDDSTDILAVGCWDRTLAFYTPGGVMQGKARKLAFNPTSLTYFRFGEYRVMSCISGEGLTWSV
ncbi:unnamed protein product [Phytophthora fragariaefolia]|uniref:Intraflagellar transport protein 122 homolog n=1 Tax=Phytophthora fragariaefolia TaxID=1490495 RepID=A0A9W7D1S8_9STRA|nr:unnamed protein product [Phytophthora fragariaefolia]